VGEEVPLDDQIGVGKEDGERIGSGRRASALLEEIHDHEDFGADQFGVSSGAVMCDLAVLAVRGEQDGPAGVANEVVQFCVHTENDPFITVQLGVIFPVL